MTKKHCVSKRGRRASGGYRRRLEARGYAFAPMMDDPKLSDGKPASAKR